jgi:hypothetical protein
MKNTINLNHQTMASGVFLFVCDELLNQCHSMKLLQETFACSLMEDESFGTIETSRNSNMLKYFHYGSVNKDA